MAKTPGIEEQPDDYWEYSRQTDSLFDDDETVSFEFPSSFSSERSKVNFSTKLTQENSNYSNELTITSEEAQKQIQCCLNSMKLGRRKSQVTNPNANVCDTINSLFEGENVNLYIFKGREEKVELLDLAIKNHNGNAITAIVLFMKNTLNRSIFNFELIKRPEAADHYVNYLKQTSQLNELVDTLTMLGRNEEAAMVRYSQAIIKKSCEAKINSLKNCLQNHFSIGDSNITFWSRFISEQISLLERQLPIETEAQRQEKVQNTPVDIGYKQRLTILNKPVITTLYYCCLYHYNLPENFLASPIAIKKFHNLSEKQYSWTALLALSHAQKWNEIDSLFEVKSWLGGKKVKSCIPFEKIVEIFNKNNAPIEIISKYLELIDDNEKKLNLAKEFKMHKSVIDMLIKLKDRLSVNEYLKELINYPQEFRYAKNALMSSDIKWKN